MGQVEQVVVGVELAHVADGFTFWDVTCRRRRTDLHPRSWFTTKLKQKQKIQTS